MPSEASDEGGEQGIFWVGDSLMFGHNGGDPGTYCELRYDKFNQFGFVMMLNADDTLDALDQQDAEELEALMSLLANIVYRRGLTMANGGD
ncbi:MAG: hypothetical protein ACI8WB_003338 [Phenylobacterium sp.]|jgi:hypothetical protein